MPEPIAQQDDVPLPRLLLFVAELSAQGRRYAQERKERRRDAGSGQPFRRALADEREEPRLVGGQLLDRPRLLPQSLEALAVQKIPALGPAFARWVEDRDIQ